MKNLHYMSSKDSKRREAVKNGRAGTGGILSPARPLLCVAALVFCAFGPLAAQQSPGQGPGQNTGTAENSPEEEQTRLTADQAVSAALKNNLSLQSGALNLDTKKRKSDLVWNQFLPDLSARGTMSRLNKKPEDTSMGPFTIPASPQWSVSANFSASLTLSAALGAGIQSIMRDYQTGILTYDKARIQMERDVRKSYNQMLLLEESIKVRRDSLAAAERQVATAQANYNSGLSPQLTLLQAQVNRDNLKPDIEEMENQYKMAMANFAMTLGFPYDTQFELAAAEGDIGFVPLDIKELVSQASQKKPDILELKANILTLQSSRTAQSLQTRTPYLRFDWGLTPTFGGDPFKNSWGDKDNWSDRGTFSITMGWQSLNGFFPFTKEGQALKDLDSQIRGANIGLAQMIQGTELEIYNTVLSLEKTQSSIEARSRTVELAERSYRSTDEAYRAGLQDFNSVQNAEEALRQARIGVVQQYFSYLNSLIDLEYAIGVPFGTLSSEAEIGENEK
ncbi:MAG: TolC family protein [Treponema sp.]|jgi:outer membrane protein TolC|nr:TolC family protein [Treponema sp.]